MAALLKVKTSDPPLLVVTVPIVVPPTTSAAPCASAPSVPVAENWSCAFAPPLRDSVSVAPLKFVLLSSASNTRTSLSRTTGLPFSV